MSDVPHADWVEEKLESLPFVEWDRFTVNNFDNGVVLMNIYGWIDRPDDHEDFVLLQLYPKKPDIWGFITSSDEYTEEIYELLFGEEADDHNSCRRVEHDLDVDNCVRLTEQSSLDVMTDGGTDAGSAEETQQSVRKHYYLIVNHPDEDLEGLVEVSETRKQNSKKNSQTIAHKRNMETGEFYKVTVVSMGYVDYDSEEQHEEQAWDDIKRKLSELDQRHLDDAGVEVQDS